MKYGYVRPIDLYDSVEQQVEKLKVETDKIYKESHSNNKRREILENLLNTQLKENDMLCVTDLFILADSTKHLLDIIYSMKKSNISLFINNMNLKITDETKITFIEALEMITQFQSDVVRFRTKQGIQRSREEGKHIGRPRRSDENLDRAIEMYFSKDYTLDEIKEKTNISRATLYRHLEK
ncbi:recombinase family protein [Staphylococcus simulans]|uniref:recombinase family protein n=1 Tax=Staphylococcus simulans TaxID=1286 RepID=UPI0021D1A270|nr:recombinase family protein [Staphylococcus simulans]UXR51290.1 recombinase family protein [Staphylococcus simulans]